MSQSDLIHTRLLTGEQGVAVGSQATLCLPAETSQVEQGTYQWRVNEGLKPM